jgi:hypothetical protein
LIFWLAFVAVLLACAFTHELWIALLWVPFVLFKITQEAKSQDRPWH